MADRTLKQGNRSPILRIVAADAIGPADLDGATATFRMVNVLTGAVKVDAAAAVRPNIAFTVSGATLTANSHGLLNNDAVTLKTSNTLPGGLSAGREYFVVNATLHTLQLALAQNGTPITTQNAGLGTHTLIAGLIEYEWQANDTDTTGTYQGQVETVRAGKPLTFPNMGHFLIEIISNLNDASDRTKAIKAVMDRVQMEVEPQLTQGEVELELDRAKLASVWQPSTFYAIHSEVVPEIRNGHAYRCVQPGTSQAGARSFNDWPHGDYATGSQFGDGSSDPQLIWKECGTDRFNPTVLGNEANVYDIGAAAKACWLIKARRCSDLINDGDLRFEAIRENCLEEAKTFRPFVRPVRIVRA